MWLKRLDNIQITDYLTKITFLHIYSAIITIKRGKMGNKRSAKRIDTVADVCKYFGTTTSNEWMCVVNLSKMTKIDPQPIYINLYCVVCVAEDKSSQQQPRIIFMPPDYLREIFPNGYTQFDGWMLCFSPSLVEGTILENRMGEYAFFNDRSLAQLLINNEEYAMMVNCMFSLRTEQDNISDKYTKRILAAGIAVLLTQCLRYYERQAPRIYLRNADIVKQMDVLLNHFFSAPQLYEGLPTVAWCAQQLHITPNYLGDLMRKYGECSAQKFIHNRTISEVKGRLERDNSSISQIAYELGFKYPHHLSRLFAKIEGCSPHDYRCSLTTK